MAARRGRAAAGNAGCCGFLRPTGAADAGHLVAAVRQGLRELGYPSDKVAIESRWADGRPERLPKLAAELVALHVTAIVGSVEASTGAKGGNDKHSNCFRNRGRSGGSGARFQYQSTGQQYHRGGFLIFRLTRKRLALLRAVDSQRRDHRRSSGREFFPISDREPRNRGGGGRYGTKIVTLNASRPQEIDAAFSTMVKSGAGALLIGPGPFLSSRRSQVIGLAALQRNPGELF